MFLAVNKDFFVIGGESCSYDIEELLLLFTSATSSIGFETLNS